MKRILLFLIFSSPLICGPGQSKPIKQTEYKPMTQAEIAAAADAISANLLRKNHQHLCGRHYQQYVNPDYNPQQNNPKKDRPT